MRLDIISKIHSYIREGRVIRRGATAAPELVQRGLCKEYQRFPKIQLARHLPTLPLGEALTKRESHPSRSSSRPLSLEDISLLLSPLSQKEDSEHRYYPSGGALYPVEAYLVSSFESDRPAVYHYHPKAHALEKLWTMAKDVNLDQLFIQKEKTKKVQAAIIFTAVWDRSAKKYGDFAYNLALLEAGHMAQNILLVATELTIEICPMGGFNEESIVFILDITNDTEQAIYSLLIC